MNWETSEVISWLLNDENAYIATRGMSAHDLAIWVLARHAPSGLYETFGREPVSQFDDVDWAAVADHLTD